MEKVAEGKYQAAIGPFTDPDRPVKSLEAVSHSDDNSWGKDIKIRLE